MKFIHLESEVRIRYKLNGIRIADFMRWNYLLSVKIEFLKNNSLTIIKNVKGSFCIDLNSEKLKNDSSMKK